MRGGTPGGFHFLGVFWFPNRDQKRHKKGITKHLLTDLLFSVLFLFFLVLFVCSFLLFSGPSWSSLVPPGLSWSLPVPLGHLVTPGHSWSPLVTEVLFSSISVDFPAVLWHEGRKSSRRIARARRDEREIEQVSKDAQAEPKTPPHRKHTFLNASGREV